MSTEGVLGAAWLPTDGYLDPSQLTFALAERAREGGARLFTSTRVTGIDSRRRPRAARAHRPRRHRGRGRGDRRRHVLGRGRPAGRRAHPDPADVARVHRHPAVPRARPGEPAAHPARPRPARLLPRGRRRPRDGRLRAAQRARVPARRRARLREHPARLQRPPAGGRLGPLRGDRRELAPARARDGEREGHAHGQRAGGLHAGQRVLPRRDRDRRPVRGGRLLRPRAGRRGRRRQGDGRVDRGGRAVARPLAHGHPPLRRAVPLALVLAEADPRDLRDLLRHQVPGLRAPGRPAAAGVARQRLARRARRRVRREVGLGAGQLVRGKRGRRRRGSCARADGPGATGRPRSAPSTPPAARPAALFDESSFAKLEIAGPGRRRAARAALRQPGRARGRPDHLHADAQLARRDRMRLHRRAARRGALLDRHRHGLRQPRPRVDPPPPARATARSRSRT